LWASGKINSLINKLSRQARCLRISCPSGPRDLTGAQCCAVVLLPAVMELLIFGLPADRYFRDSKNLQDRAKAAVLIYTPPLVVKPIRFNGTDWLVRYFTTLTVIFGQTGHSKVRLS
jgi:hypothetical protein